MPTRDVGHVEASQEAADQLYAVESNLRGKDLAKHQIAIEKAAKAAGYNQQELYEIEEAFYEWYQERRKRK